MSAVVSNAPQRYANRDTPLIRNCWYFAGLSPLTRERYHYQWFLARDFALEDAAAAKFLQETTVEAYLEDVDALQWIEQTVALETQPFREMNFPSDRPGMEMRRIIQRLAEIERDP